MQSRLERGADALAARCELADRIRELIEASLRCHGSPEDLRATSTRLAALTDELRALGDGAASIPDGLDGRASLYLNNFVRFAPCGIGFHQIPTYKSSGAQIHADWLLGTNYRASHGCIRVSASMSVAIWSFAAGATRVVVMR